MLYYERNLQKFNNVRQRILYDTEEFVIRVKNAKTYEELESILLTYTDDMDSTIQDCINYREEMNR